MANTQQSSWTTGVCASENTCLLGSPRWIFSSQEKSQLLCGQLLRWGSGRQPSPLLLSARVNPVDQCQIIGWREKLGLFLPPQQENTAFCFLSLASLCASTYSSWYNCQAIHWTSLAQEEAANSRHFRAMQLYRWPKQQFASALHHQSISSEESQHLPSPCSMFLPVPARSLQADTDVVSPPSKQSHCRSNARIISMPYAATMNWSQ